MKKIKALWPEQPLVLVCRKGVGQFFAQIGVVDQVLEIKKGEAESYRQVLKTLKSLEIEKIISPHESLRTAFFVQKLKAKRKVGFQKSWNGLFFNERVLKNYDLPDAIRQLSLLQNYDENLKQDIAQYRREGKPYAVGGQGQLAAVPAWSSMSLRAFYDERRSEIPALLEKLSLKEASLQKSVALFPGSVWATKRWTEEGFVQTGQTLAAEGVSVLVMGGPGEEALCQRVTEQIPGALNLCAKTSIYESALILSTLAAVIGNDSASMHLAATGEVPSVVIFGPTVLKFGFRPWQNQVAVVEKEGMACRPCGKHGHKACPLGTHACMKEITKDEVLAKLASLR